MKMKKKICSCNVSLNQPSIVLKHEGSNWHPSLEKKKTLFTAISSSTQLIILAK